MMLIAFDSDARSLDNAPTGMSKAKGKTIVITGVTRGLGRAMAEEFLRLGNVVIGCGRSQDAIEQLRKAAGQPHDFDTVNVASDEAVQLWAQRVIKIHGAPDLLLNNAAIINRNAPLWKVAAQDFSDVIDVNIKGVANVIRHFVPAMIHGGTGVIVNFSSGWGRSADKEVGPYVATKWAIEGLTQTLSLELPPGLAAVSLNPGIINTDMLRSCFGESASHYPSPSRWADRAVPYLLKIDSNDNGHQLSVPEM